MGDIVALVGNGLSIAYNTELALPSLTRALLDEFEDAGAELQQLAEHIKQDRGPAEIGFEDLIGPFDDLYDAMPVLRALSRLGLGRDDVTDATERLEDFTRDVRRAGVSRVLETIDARSRDQPSWMPINDFVGALAEEADALTIGNLNYDNVVMSAALESRSDQVCDLADAGEGERTMYPVGATIPLRCFRLRSQPNLPDSRQIRCLQLHGSTRWLRSPEDGYVYQFAANPLRTHRYWEKWRQYDTDWLPEVVLTNQGHKATLTQRQPFALAFEAFEVALSHADRWVIVGYSFQDGHVNRVLARAYERRGSERPKILVVTKSSASVGLALREALGLAHGESPDDLYVWTQGVEGAHGTQVWRAWVT